MMTSKKRFARWSFRVLFCARKSFKWKKDQFRCKHKFTVVNLNVTRDFSRATRHGGAWQHWIWTWRGAWRVAPRFQKKWSTWVVAWRNFYRILLTLFFKKTVIFFFFNRDWEVWMTWNNTFLRIHEQKRSWNVQKKSSLRENANVAWRVAAWRHGQNENCAVDGARRTDIGNATFLSISFPLSKSKWKVLARESHFPTRKIVKKWKVLESLESFWKVFFFFGKFLNESPWMWKFFFTQKRAFFTDFPKLSKNFPKTFHFPKKIRGKWKVLESGDSGNKVERKVAFPTSARLYAK